MQDWSEKMKERIDEAQTETRSSENVNVVRNRKEEAVKLIGNTVLQE
jgi:hypothetical protein